MQGQQIPVCHCSTPPALFVTNTFAIWNSSERHQSMATLSPTLEHQNKKSEVKIKGTKY
ncbi:hypothetical protein HanPSC8_Chr01g0033151 [Helianthus annuus]|nr:hypothetical protein HanPSC8_Chr01g0033151 [Helianthus annuus]